MITVYISSTFSDLEEYRDEVCRVLTQMRYAVRAMEYDAATDERPVDTCLADVEGCDVYIGIFALRYGFIPPHNNPKSISITELEYRKASELGKPRLIFLLEDGASWPSIHIDGVTGENDRGGKIAALRTELAREHNVSYFTSEAELARQVSVAMTEWARRQARHQDRRQDRRQARHQDGSKPATTLSEALKAAYQREKALIIQNADASAVRAEIRDLKRQLREGGQLQPGDFLLHDRFELIEHIGQGGFARVWKAFDQQRRDIVAIKVLHGQYAQDRSRRERFFRGARLMVNLRHPGIVSVYEAEVEDEGYYFFVMEYMEGGDFHQAVMSNRLSIDQRLAVIQTVGEALGYAHDQGLVHRDIKPANILLDQQGNPKLTDFDLVRAEAVTTGMTQTGMLGTFIYAAPELMSRPQDAGVKADVYGLAMTTMFALYGAELPPEVFRDPRSIINRLAVSDATKTGLTKGLAWDEKLRWESVTAFCKAVRMRKHVPDGPLGFRDRFVSGKGEGPTMVNLPGGTFIMGDSSGNGDTDERPAHEVTLSAFAIGRYPITVAEYMRFVESTGSHYPEWLEPGGYYHIQTGMRDHYRRARMSLADGAHPVVGISWRDAEAYCEWLSAQTEEQYQLPTEAQWEYACRAGSRANYCFGRDRSQLANYAWYDENAGDYIHPVGGKQANAWGLYDMHGNVWEWVEDWYGEYSAEPQYNPRGPKPGSTRVFRGGSWRYIAGNCRSSFRGSGVPSVRSPDLGFRLARQV